MENCLSCKWSKDWCCPKNKARGMITCMQPDLLKGNKDIPLEIDSKNKCNKYEKCK
jgi:hypothetical protein